nr:MAG TPA: hypothetical protein [Caudoviricetes sp.]
MYYTLAKRFFSFKRKKSGSASRYRTSRVYDCGFGDRPASLTV